LVTHNSIAHQIKLFKYGCDIIQEPEESEEESDHKEEDDEEVDKEAKKWEKIQEREKAMKIK